MTLTDFWHSEECNFWYIPMCALVYGYGKKRDVFLNPNQISLFRDLYHVQDKDGRNVGFNFPVPESLEGKNVEFRPYSVDVNSLFVGEVVTYCSSSREDAAKNIILNRFEIYSKWIASGEYGPIDL